MAGMGVENALLDERLEHLLGEKRIASGSAVDKLHEFVRSPLDAEPNLDQLTHVCEREAAQRKLLQKVVADHLRQQFL
jgi:hypothetical protein